MALSKQMGDPRYKSPGFAGFLSLLPGLGQIYVGYYPQGFINVTVFGSVFAILVGQDFAPYTPLGIIFLMFFELYNVIDAYRRAELYNLTLDGLTDIELPDSRMSSFDNLVNGSYVGGIALLVFGGVALSYTAFGFSLDWVESWWPVAPIAFGAYLVYMAWRESGKNPD